MLFISRPEQFITTACISKIKIGDWKDNENIIKRITLFIEDEYYDKYFFVKKIYFPLCIALKDSGKDNIMEISPFTTAVIGNDLRIIMN